MSSGDLFIRMLSFQEWAPYAEAAHAVAFQEMRKPTMERLDFVFVAEKNGAPAAYVTCREFDAESLYFSRGGAFPITKGSVRSFHAFLGFVGKSRELGYKRITYLVHNKNKAMLKFTLAADFLAIGCRTIDGETYIEFLKTLEEN